MKRARKAWSGGKRPELSAVDLVFIDHAEKCQQCKDHPLSLCAPGRDLYEAVLRQHEPGTQVRFECVPSVGVGK